MAARRKIVSDATWKALLARAWPPGHYKRWYLRALQEEFDARLYPYGWSTPEFSLGRDWLPVMQLGGSPNKPAVATNYYEYMLDVGGSAADTELRPRSIPLLRETLVPAQRLAESHWLEWLRPPEEYFECRTPGAFRAAPARLAHETASGQWEVKLEGTRGAALTFEFAEQVVGWPYFTIEAPAGTTIELLVHEAHRLGGPPLLNTHFDSWTRFICRQGVNRFETFDFESLRWLQLHMRNGTGAVTIREVGVRRRMFPWPHTPDIRVSEPALQRLLDASINTLHNCAQETCVDGMARERQQYSGDGGHQLHGLYLPFGETRLPARFLTTFSQGMTLDGFFLDCWPAYDRLARLIERQLHLSGWGPILDHGVGFNFDCWHYYNYTGDLEALQEPYPRLLRFAQYLHRLVGRDGLLPVENLGIPSVWIDHSAYQQQRHKQCAFNLYAAAMLQQALGPICRAFGDVKREKAVCEFGQDLLAATVKKFWSKERGLFVNNLPWLAEEKKERLCDRSLATAILFGQCPQGTRGGRIACAVRVSAGDGFLLSVQRGLALVGAGQGWSRRPHRKRPARALGHDGIGEVEQHLAGRLAVAARQRRAMEPLRGGAALHCLHGAGGHSTARAWLQGRGNPSATGGPGATGIDGAYGARAVAFQRAWKAGRPRVDVGLAAKLRRRVGGAPRGERTARTRHRPSSRRPPAVSAASGEEHGAEAEADLTAILLPAAGPGGIIGGHA